MFLYYFLILWTFCFGTIFGSFLNVVIWRLPLHMSLSFPASHCPRCGRPIRKRHNVPILGWLVLRGRCYDCKAPISIRYPFVEFLGGLGFVLIFAPIWFPWSQDPEYPTYLLQIHLLHGISKAVCYLTFLAMGLIVRDKNRIPMRLFLFPIPFLLLTCQFVSGIGLLLGLVLSRFSFCRSRVGRIVSLFFFLFAIQTLL